MPDDPDAAIAAGKMLCEELLEPLQGRFGRLAIRSAYRSCEVNGLGNALQIAGKVGYNCAANSANYAGNIWDRPDTENCAGATACIVIPAYWDQFQAASDWQKLAWWIHDHLPYSDMEFFPNYWAFNINWREQARQRIFSFTNPKGWLTKPGMHNHAGNHEALWTGIERAFT